MSKNIFIFFILLTSSVESQSITVASLEEKKNKLEQNSQFKSDTAYINTLNEIAFKVAYSDTKKMFLYATQAKELSENINYNKGFLEGKNNLADYSMFKGELDKALLQHDEILKRVNNEKLIALRSLNSKAFIYEQKSDYPSSYKTLQEGLIIAEDLENQLYRLRVKMNLGNLMAYLGSTEEALNYYRESLDFELGESSSFARAEVLANMGYSYLVINELESSIKHISEAILIFEKENIEDWLAYCYSILGRNYLKKNDLKTAYSFLQKSDSIYVKIDDPRGKSDLNITYAEYHLKQNEIKKAERKAITAYNTSKQLSYFDGQILSAEVLSTIYQKNRNNKKALEFKLLANKLNDSIERENNKNKLAILKVKNDLEIEKEREIYDYKDKLFRQKTVIFITILIISFLLIIIVLVRRNNKIQSQNNSELQKINILKDKVFTIIGHDLKAPIGTLQELLSLYGKDNITAEEFKKITPRLKENVDHSSFSLNNLLVWAQTQMKGIYSNPEHINLKSALDNTISLYKERLLKKNISLSYDISDSIAVHVDKEHLNIILRNIISNAIKYSFPNELISLSAFEQNNEITIEICDKGVGMDSLVLDKIFEGGHPQSTLGTEKEKGTGLGLNICLELLAKNNGKLNIKSEAQVGSCFYITLPSSQNIGEIHIFNDKTHKKT